MAKTFKHFQKFASLEVTMSKTTVNIVTRQQGPDECLSVISVSPETAQALADHIFCRYGPFFGRWQRVTDGSGTKVPK